MRTLVLLAAVVGGVIGVAFVGPALIQISPWLAAALFVALLAGWAWWEVRGREEEQNREVTRRWHRPERRE